MWGKGNRESWSWWIWALHWYSNTTEYMKPKGFLSKCFMMESKRCALVTIFLISFMTKPHSVHKRLCSLARLWKPLHVALSPEVLIRVPLCDSVSSGHQNCLGSKSWSELRAETPGKIPSEVSLSRYGSKIHPGVRGWIIKCCKHSEEADRASGDAGWSESYHNTVQTCRLFTKNNTWSPFVSQWHFIMVCRCLFELLKCHQGWSNIFERGGKLKATLREI